MSAEIIPMPGAQDCAPPSNITPMPAAPAPPAEDMLSRLLKNPLVIAGGTVLAGMALTRLFATPSMQKLARDLAAEAFKRARQTTGDTPAAPSLIDDAIESVRPQITEAARGFLADILKRR